MTTVDTETEVAAAVNDVALVDRSALGKIRVTGADRLELLHRLSTNDLINLAPHSSSGTIFTNEKGRVVDYVRVLVHGDFLLLVTSSGREKAVKEWIDKYTIMEDIQVSIVTDDLIVYSVVGPKGFSLLQTIFPDMVRAGGMYCGYIGGAPCTVDFQAEFSVEISNIIARRDVSPLVMSEFSNGRHLTHLHQMSPEAYECFRIARGIPQAGTELVDLFNPYEVNLRHAISFTKGCYIGQEVIARIDTYQKTRRGLIGLELDQKLDVRNAPVLHLHDGEEIGVITSVSNCPVNGKFPALAVARYQPLDKDKAIEVHTLHSVTKGVVMNIFQ